MEKRRPRLERIVRELGHWLDYERYSLFQNQIAGNTERLLLPDC